MESITPSVWSYTEDIITSEENITSKNITFEDITFKDIIISKEICGFKFN